MKAELVLAYTVMQPRVMKLLEKKDSHHIGFILRELAVQIIDLEKALSQYDEIVGDGSSVDWKSEDVQCLREEIKDTGEILNALGSYELMAIVCDIVCITNPMAGYHISLNSIWDGIGTWVK